MRFWRGRLWIFIALLAMCNSSPLAARLCAPANQMSAMANCADDSNLEISALCCCDAETPLLVCVAAPLPALSPQVWSDAPSEAVLPPALRLETLPVQLIAPRQVTLPPPRQVFDSFRSCRAPPFRQV